jgi:hypothetical protein
MMKKIPRPLDPIELRVLGALLEKEQTTPDYYPLTENALVAACNQKSNREPVMELTETDVADALDRLFVDVLVWKTVAPRSVKWEQNTKRRWALEPPAKAVMTELLVRGPQTVGELKTRASRMHPFESTDEVEAVLAELAEGPEPLVTELGRQPGHKWPRWAHLVGGPVEEAVSEARSEPAVRTDVSAEPTAAAPADSSRYGAGVADQVEALEERVARLEAELAALKAELGITPSESKNEQSRPKETAD